MKNRIKKLFKAQQIEDNMGVFVSNESNVTYMSGFTGEASFLILSKNGHVLMTDGRYDEQARLECGDEFEVTKWHNPRRPDPETIIHYLKQFKIERLIFNDHDLSFRNYDHLTKALNAANLEVELVPLSGIIESIRSIKEPEEIACLRIACDIADEALKKTVPFIKEGVTELEVVAELEYHLKMSGAENLSFDTIVLSGTKTSFPHGKPSDKKLEKGDFLQLDFGAVHKGYHSDMSRTFIIGEATEKQKSLYQMMLRATLESTDVLRDGISAKVPDAKVREIISEEYIDYYYPGLGHGVGLDVHEEPSMSQTSKQEILAGQVVTIEPGVYVPNWGGMRIEDTILVTRDGYEVLTKYPRVLEVLR